MLSFFLIVFMACRNNQNESELVAAATETKTTAAEAKVAESRLPDYSWVVDTISYLKANKEVYVEWSKANKEVYVEWSKANKEVYVEWSKANNKAYTEFHRNLAIIEDQFKVGDLNAYNIYSKKCRQSSDEVGKLVDLLPKSSALKTFYKKLQALESTRYSAYSQNQNIKDKKYSQNQSIKDKKYSQNQSIKDEKYNQILVKYNEAVGKR